LTYCAYRIYFKADAFARFVLVIREFLPAALSPFARHTRKVLSRIRGFNGVGCRLGYFGGLLVNHFAAVAVKLFQLF
jgi:hypothetical protein